MATWEKMSDDEKLRALRAQGSPLLPGDPLAVHFGRKYDEAAEAGKGHGLSAGEMLAAARLGMPLDSYKRFQGVVSPADYLALREEEKLDRDADRQADIERRVAAARKAG